LARQLGDLVARGMRSAVHVYGCGAVVKVPAPSTPEESIGSEAQFAEAARAAGAPVPRLLGLERIDGRLASVWEHVEGTPMSQRAVDRPDQSAALGRLLADVQDGLFALVAPDVLPRQRDRLESKIRRMAATVDASFARALELLPPPDGTPRLCHGDMHPSNVILGRDGPVVVDWLDASRGDPIADIARSLLLLGDGAAALTDAYLARLRERRAIDDELLARWQAVGAVARMAEGVPVGPLLAIWTRFHHTAAS
jgi:aminoglycoside phosphotransferase (APT) family kinase protein